MKTLKMLCLKQTVRGKQAALHCEGKAPFTHLAARVIDKNVASKTEHLGAKPSSAHCAPSTQEAQTGGSPPVREKPTTEWAPGQPEIHGKTLPEARSGPGRQWHLTPEELSIF